jgi:hypothetical protein
MTMTTPVWQASIGEEDFLLFPIPQRSIARDHFEKGLLLESKLLWRPEIKES